MLNFCHRNILEVNDLSNIYTHTPTIYHSLVSPLNF
jgi:hypothetical protein